MLGLGLLYSLYRATTAPPAYKKKTLGSPPKALSDDETVAALPGIIAGLKETSAAGTTRSYAWRIQQLRAIQALHATKSTEIYAAQKADINKPAGEWFFERKAIEADLKQAIAGLSGWMAPASKATPFGMQPATGYTKAEPYGTVRRGGG
eukprot:SAG22_NODE_6920_length_795_cov_0.938218_2_plen_149_part_01